MKSVFADMSICRRTSSLETAQVCQDKRARIRIMSPSSAGEIVSYRTKLLMFRCRLPKARVH
eukprot:scaffold219266_cov15-Prasinocladus_malaysianus.AAC.1